MWKPDDRTDRADFRKKACINDDRLHVILVQLLDELSDRINRADPG